MSTNVCFLNGRYVDARRAVIPALDRGFLFGEGLFETWRTYRGRPYALREHLERMAVSANVLGIPFDIDEPWEARSLKLARLNGMQQRGGAVRLTITRGAGPVALVPVKTAKPTRLMLFRPFEPGLPEARRRGVRVHLMSIGCGVHADMRRLKTLNYLPAVIGKVRARERGCFESVYVLDDGTVLEGTTSNVFRVAGGVLETAPITAGVLPGVTRNLVLRLARRLLPIRERVFDTEDLCASDEVFLTSSSIEVLPVTHAGRRRIARGGVGPLTRELQALYRVEAARRLGVTVAELGD